jgi:hypothetical protein
VLDPGWLGRVWARRTHILASPLLTRTSSMHLLGIIHGRAKNSAIFSATILAGMRLPDYLGRENSFRLHKRCSRDNRWSEVRSAPGSSGVPPSCPCARVWFAVRGVYSPPRPQCRVTLRAPHMRIRDLLSGHPFNASDHSSHFAADSPVLRRRMERESPQAK